MLPTQNGGKEWLLNQSGHSPPTSLYKALLFAEPDGLCFLLLYEREDG